MIDLIVFMGASDTPIFKAVLIKSALHSLPLPIYSSFDYLGNVALAPIYKFIFKLSINIITSIKRKGKNRVSFPVPSPFLVFNTKERASL